MADQYYTYFPNKCLDHRNINLNSLYIDLKRRCVGQYELWKKQREEKKKQKSLSSKPPSKSLLHSKSKEGKICRKIAILNMTAEGRSKLKKSEAIFSKARFDPDKLTELAKDKDFEVYKAYHLQQEKNKKATDPHK